MLIPFGAIFAGVGASILRGVGGWWENAADEKSEGGEKITPFEWAKLGATTVRVTIISLAVYFPLNAFGLDGAELGAAGSAVVLDFILKAMKKKKTLVIEEEAEETKE